MQKNGGLFGNGWLPADCAVERTNAILPIREDIESGGKKNSANTRKVKSQPRGVFPQNFSPIFPQLLPGYPCVQKSLTIRPRWRDSKKKRIQEVWRFEIECERQLVDQFLTNQKRLSMNLIDGQSLDSARNVGENQIVYR